VKLIPSHVQFFSKSNIEKTLKCVLFGEVTHKTNLAPFLWLTVYIYTVFQK